jgi:hypothetical protein
MRVNRRTFLRQTGFRALAATAFFASPARNSACSRVSGAGSYQLGPFDPVNRNEELVYLLTDLGFDETMVFCKITTNFAPLLFRTARLGVVEFAAHEFYMDMHSVSISSLNIQEGTEGPVAIYAGILRSETRLFSGARMQMLVEENVAFGCRANGLSTGERIAVTGNYFSMTANFDPRQRHSAIFGAQPTFAGRLTQGNITVIA